MKSSIFTLMVLCLLALATNSMAQDKKRNDHTYSTANYKHANKAATARQWEANKGVAVQQPQPGDANVANYKRQTPVQQPAGGVTVDHTPSTDVAERNYKMQRPAQSATNNAAIAGKRKGKMVETTIGD